MQLEAAMENVYSFKNSASFLWGYMCRPVGGSVIVYRCEPRYSLVERILSKPQARSTGRNNSRIQDGFLVHTGRTPLVCLISNYMCEAKSYHIDYAIR